MSLVQILLIQIDYALIHYLITFFLIIPITSEYKYPYSRVQSKICWNIIIRTRKTPPIPENNMSNDIKKEHQEYTQSHTIAKSILMYGGLNRVCDKSAFLTFSKSKPTTK